MQRDQLKGNLDLEAFSATLNACEIPDKEEYTDEEFQKFNQARQMIDQGKTYEEITSFFQSGSTQPSENGSEGNGAEPTPKAKRSGRNGKKPIPPPELLEENELPQSPITFPQLMKLASEEVGKMSWTEGAEILKACGLPDDGDYTYNSEEVSRFMEGCDLVKNQGVLLEDIGELMGMSVDSVVEVTDQQMSAIKARYMQQRAEEQVIEDQKQYLRVYADVARNSQRIQEFWADVELRAEAYLEGKSRNRLKGANSPRISLPPSSNS
jgi:hypothetical protein